MNCMKNKQLLGLTAVILIFLTGVFLIKPPGYSENSADLDLTPIHRTDFLLNTFVDVAIYDSDDTSILDQALKLCRDYEARFSRTMKSSEIYKLNHRSPDEQTFTLSDETANLIRIALQYSELSDGAFDITTEPLSSLWNFTGNNPSIPSREAIDEAKSKVGWQNLKLEGNTLTFLSPDTTIDLGAIAKGYIADRLKEFLLESGVKSAMINLGGNVLCVGSRPGGAPFHVGLKKPFSGTMEVFENLGVHDMSVVASGVYERHFVLDGKNYHHILNPATGYPVDNGLVSVTILSQKSVDGDALSTTCFSLGLEKGMELINSLDHTYACFVDQDSRIYYSEGMESFLLGQSAASSESEISP